MSNDANTSRPLSPDDIILLNKYRDFARPPARLVDLDDFVKWIFTSITVVGSLGAAFSTSAIKDFTTAGAFCFFAAIGLTGISLFLAVLARAVEPGLANTASLEDMVKADLSALETKKILARCAGGAFALAALVAGAAPLASLLSRSSAQESVCYSIGKDGAKFTATLAVPADQIGQIKVLAQQTSTATLIASAQARADAKGVLKLDTAGSIPADSSSLRLVLACNVKDPKINVVDIAIKQNTLSNKSDNLSSLVCASEKRP